MIDICDCIIDNQIMISNWKFALNLYSSLRIQAEYNQQVTIVCIPKNGTEWDPSFVDLILIIAHHSNTHDHDHDHHPCYYVCYYHVYYVLAHQYQQIDGLNIIVDPLCMVVRTESPLQLKLHLINGIVKLVMNLFVYIVFAVLFHRMLMMLLSLIYSFGAVNFCC